MQRSPNTLPNEERILVKDIYELIRQKESEFERVQKEVEALRIAVRLLDENSESRTTTVNTPAAARDSQGYAATPAPRANTPAATPTPWASAKQFP